MRDLAAEYGTPLLVLDEDDLRARCRAWREAFDGWPSGADVAYAGKAFLAKAVVRIVRRRAWASTSAPAVGSPSRWPPASRRATVVPRQ